MIHLRNEDLRTQSELDRLLLDEVVQPIEARDVLRTLLGSLQQREKLRNLSHQVRSQEPDPEAQVRMVGLERASGEAEELLRAAVERGARLRVRTRVELSLEDPDGMPQR